MMRRKVFYFAFDHGNPSGGIKEAYRHVEILNRNGTEAYIVHQREGANATWFEHCSPVVSLHEFSKLFDESSDVIVVPEDMPNVVQSYSGNKVIFNQNVFYGFAALGAKKPAQYPYLDPSVKAAFCVSEYNATFLRYAYPNLAVHELYVGIDSEKFGYRTLAEKSRKICLYIRKNPVHNLMLLHIAQSRAAQNLNALREFQWIILDGTQTESEVSAALRESLLFIFLSIEEGCPLMPLEAAASGALTFVYDTGPATDWVSEECQFPYGDLIGMLGVVERIAQDFSEDVGKWQAIAAQARQRAALFSFARREKRLLDVWEKVFGQLA